MLKTVKYLIVLFTILIIYKPANSCTTAILSGKYTKDGRPVLWKLRDTDFLKNKIVYFEDGNFPYIGLVNTKDTNGTQVWAGTNSVGFAIMNAALYDVNLDDTTNKKDREGFVMKKALQQCKTLADFEKMLEKMPKPWGLASSFGVIDASGGAAYYEVDNNSFVKFDANDKRFAPQGYIIRTNYSYRGEKDKGYGYIRFQNAQQLFQQADACGNLNYRKIITDFSRSAYHSLLKKDYRRLSMKKSNTSPYFVNSGDLIVRNSSSAGVIIKGVKPGESPEMTTMWSLLGYPFCTVACPLWVAGGNNIPEILTGEEDGQAPLCRNALKLKEKCYPIKRGSGHKYLKMSAIYNAEQTGIAQKLKPVELKILRETEKKMEKWHKEGVHSEELADYYQWLNNFISMKYEEMFGLTM
jgi:hypothetical protein